MKNVKIITIILAIILVTAIAFGGVYIKTQNRMENKVKEYLLGRELQGGRIVGMQVVKGDEGTNTENLTTENYETVKKTVEERLKMFGAQDYTISLNHEDGTIVVELPEDVNTDTYAYLLTADAKVQIKEKDAGTELLSDAMVKKALYTYTMNAEGAYKVLLQLHLTEEGQAKIEEIKNNYAILADEVEEIEKAQEAKKEEAEKGGEDATATENTTTEDTATETQTEAAKKIAQLTIAGTAYDIDEIDDGKIIVAIGSETTNQTNVNNSIAVAAEIATLISSGKYPVEYEIGNNRFVNSDITNKELIYVAIAIAVVLLIVFVVFTIKYKTNGLLASISFIGFGAILSLLLRYTNVNISIEGIGAIILVFIINVIVNKNLLEKEVDYKKLLLNLVPITIITLVFCFADWSNLSSFGMIMFWGLVLIAAYNALVTKTLLKLKESK